MADDFDFDSDSDSDLPSKPPSFNLDDLRILMKNHLKVQEKGLTYIHYGYQSDTFSLHLALLDLQKSTNRILEQFPKDRS